MTEIRWIPPSPALRAGAVLLVLASAACARSAPLAPVAPAAPDFARLADSIVSTPPLHRAHIGIEVYAPVAKRVLYRHNADRHFVPASNQKYWPTTTALHVLGPDWRYRTPVLGIGFDAGTGAAKALVVVGRGDPTWSERFHAPDPPVVNAAGDTVPARPDPAVSHRRSLSVLDSLADSLVARGVKRVEGDLVVDASLFDEAIIPGAWTFGNLNGTSAPPTGAFVVAEGVMVVQVAPGPSQGTPAVVTPWTPAGVVPVASKAVTGEAAAPPTPGEERGFGRGRISTQRGPWSDTLRIQGSIPLGAEPQLLRLPMTDPVVFAANALADALRGRGSAIDGTVRVVRDSAEAEALRGGRLGSEAAPLPVRELTAWSSPTLGVIVKNILQPSQNWMAEQLLRTLGAEKRGTGSWRDGIDVEMEFLVGTVGVDSTALGFNDGSGMSPQNLVTPHAIVQLLEYARTAPWGQVFHDGLTGPGRPGTLSNRLRGLEGRAFGKTGTLNGVNAVSGYVTTPEGRDLIFSIISNASGLGSGPVVSAIDQMIMALGNGIVPR
ncbi:MAG: D-alanyl-D-alanine carboxypeptidase/D-alanyl-D-alanine-endopeptidase [Gemmatimonadetes bacterium]|nr:D-alanyl-D-alanine carboxypeptidase/D-alanyl-D-alanine-endopeptidase [Gemmatimonadota bacterium]